MANNVPINGATDLKYTPAKPVTAKIKKTSKLPSLQELATRVNSAPVEDQTITIEEKPQLHQPKGQVFGLKELKACWQEFAKKKKIEGKAREYILLNEDVELLEGNIIEIKLSNAVQEDTLEAIKTDLLIFLRNKLNNESITIVSKIHTSDSRKRLYTTREKFEHLAQKHPLLKELKERLGLDPDF